MSLKLLRGYLLLNERRQTQREEMPVENLPEWVQDELDARNRKHRKELRREERNAKRKG